MASSALPRMDSAVKFSLGLRSGEGVKLSILLAAPCGVLPSIRTKSWKLVCPLFCSSVYCMTGEPRTFTFLNMLDGNSPFCG